MKPHSGRRRPTLFDVLPAGMEPGSAPPPQVLPGALPNLAAAAAFAAPPPSLAPIIAASTSHGEHLCHSLTSCGVNMPGRGLQPPTHHRAYPRPAVPPICAPRALLRAKCQVVRWAWAWEDLLRSASRPRGMPAASTWVGCRPRPPRRPSHRSSATRWPPSAATQQGQVIRMLDAMATAAFAGMLHAYSCTARHARLPCRYPNLQRHQKNQGSSSNVGACAVPSSSCCPRAGNSVLNVYINREKNFAFVELRTGGLFLCTDATGSLLPRALNLHAARLHTQPLAFEVV